MVLNAIISPSGANSPISEANRINVESGIIGTNLLYFQPKKKFNLMGYIMANPMMLMMGFMAIMAFALVVILKV